MIIGGASGPDDDSLSLQPINAGNQNNYASARDTAGMSYSGVNLSPKSANAHLKPPGMGNEDITDQIKERQLELIAQIRE